MMTRRKTLEIRKVTIVAGFSLFALILANILMTMVAYHLNSGSMVTQSKTLRYIDQYSSDRANACIVILCRNSDREAMAKTLINFESQFNKQFKYPYVFLNDKPFEEVFKTTMQNIIDRGSEAQTSFGLVPEEHWSYPSWIDQDLAALKRQEMVKQKVPYGSSESYRFMCRYFSGFLHKHPLLLGYDYYWRIEPGVQFFCEINYDVFKFMRDHEKIYGFVIAMEEHMETIPSLWRTVMMDTDSSPVDDKLLAYFGNSHQEDGYGGCHFWTNFEIANFAFFRSPEYQKFFERLDQSGGFFYERWGDAPVHSIAVGLFLKRGHVHYFDDIGYEHETFSNCPFNESKRKHRKCKCSPFCRKETPLNKCSLAWRALVSGK